jgi:hypothetical protein
MRTRIAVLIGAAAFIAAGIWGTAGAFGAVTAGAGCNTVVHRDLSDVKIDNDKDGTTTNSTTTLLDAGVQVSTPDHAAKMYARFTTVFPLADVTKMSYRTYRYSSSTDSIVVPAYEIEVLLSGHANTDGDPLPDGWSGPWFTTLVYEPYQAEGNAAILEDTWQTWDAEQDGAAKWWSTHPLTAIDGDGGQATPETWSSILAAYPNAVGINYYINQGSGNAGAVTAFDDVTFGTSAGCTTQRWTDAEPVVVQPAPSASRTAPVVGGAGYPGASPTASHHPAPTPAGRGNTTPAPVGAAPVTSPSPTEVAAAAAETSAGGLALTGPDFMVPAGFGLMLTISGAILFRIARRRRQMTY